MQHLKDSGTTVLYIGRTVLKGFSCNFPRSHGQKFNEFSVESSVTLYHCSLTSIFEILDLPSCSEFYK
jgi:hypothetical protein